MFQKRLECFLDIESTLLIFCQKTNLSNLAWLSLNIVHDGRIFRILEEFNGYQDPEG